MHSSPLISQIISIVTQLSGPAAYGTIVGILFICGLGIPIPEDITLLATGLLASSGQISLAGGLAAGFIGVLLGDSLLFFMGRRFGKKIFNLPGLRRLMPPSRVALAEEKIRQHGPFICFVARFLPGLRSPVFAMAGALGVRRSTYLLLDGFAAAISVPLWVLLGYWFGNNFDEALKRTKDVQIYILASLATLILGYIAFKIIRARRRKRAAQFPQV